MNPKKITAMKTSFVPFVTIITPESTTVLNREGAFAFGILSNEAFPHFRFIKDAAWLNQSPFSNKGTGPKCLFQRPYGWVKCTVCKKKNCLQACQACGSAYCTEPCWIKEMFPHAEKCGSFWCMLDIFQKQEGAVNNVKCPPPIHNHICHYCYRVKTPAVIKCEKCQRVQYCSMQCQEKDWKETHAKLCAVYRKEEEEEEEEEKVGCDHAQCKCSGVCLLHE